MGSKKPGLLLGSVVIAAAQAAPPPRAADPAAIVQAFTETCRQGFPDLNRIAAAATAAGWQESRMQRFDGVADLAAAPPRAFRKDGRMLFLDTAAGGAIARVCQVADTAPTRQSGAEVATLASPILALGAASPDPSAPDLYTWPAGPHLRFRGGVQGDRRFRTMTFSAQEVR